MAMSLVLENLPSMLLFPNLGRGCHRASATPTNRVISIAERC
jgi:hypothetical protein